MHFLRVKPTRWILLCILLTLFLAHRNWALSLYAQASTEVEVAVPVANVRSGPGTTYAIVGKANRGNTFPVIGTNPAQTWYQISFTDGQEAWLFGGLVTVTSEAPTVTPPPATAAPVAPVSDQANSAFTVQIAQPRINLRSGPGTNFAVTGTATQGEQFTVVAHNQTTNWYEIQLANGSTAWIYAPLTQVRGATSAVSGALTSPAAPTESTAPLTVPTAAPTATPAAAGPAPALAGGVVSGRLLYSVANEEAERWELWEYTFDTQANAKIADWRTELDLSKDGRQIAYFAWPGDVGEQVGIWIMDADFTNNRLLVAGGAYPSFNPGGDRLVVNGGDTMYVINSDGQGLRPLAKGEYPAWNPVDNRIVHRACVGGSCGLWIIDANSTDPNARQHLTTGGSDGQPAWSPDGQRIAYISQEDGNFEIYVINSDGSGKTRVTNELSSDGLPVWSPDGSWLAFRSDRGGSWAIYIVRPDGSNLQKVIDADVLPLWFFEKMIWRR